MTDSSNEPIKYPVDGTLDLHMFTPSDTHEVVTEYIRTCLKKGVLHLRIVHGKGIGVKRRIVHSILENHPNVISFRHEGGSGGSWGATVVNLRL